MYSFVRVCRRSSPFVTKALFSYDRAICKLGIMRMCYSFSFLQSGKALFFSDYGTSFLFINNANEAFLLFSAFAIFPSCLAQPKKGFPIFCSIAPLIAFFIFQVFAFQIMSKPVNTLTFSEQRESKSGTGNVVFVLPVAGLCKAF